MNTIIENQNYLGDRELVSLMSSQIKKEQQLGYKYCIKNLIPFKKLIKINDTPNEIYIYTISKYISNKIELHEQVYIDFLDYIFEKLYKKRVEKADDFNKYSVKVNYIDYSRLNSAIRFCCEKNPIFFYTFVDYAIRFIEKKNITDVKNIYNRYDYLDVVFSFFLQQCFWILFEENYLEKKRGSVFYLQNKDIFEWYENNKNRCEILFHCSDYGQSYADNVLQVIDDQERMMRQNEYYTEEKVSMKNDDEFIDYLIYALSKKGKDTISINNKKIKSRLFSIFNNHFDYCAENGLKGITLYEFDHEYKEEIKRVEYLLDVYLKKIIPDTSLLFNSNNFFNFINTEYFNYYNQKIDTLSSRLNFSTLCKKYIEELIFKGKDWQLLDYVLNAYEETYWIYHFQHNSSFEKQFTFFDFLDNGYYFVKGNEIDYSSLMKLINDYFIRCDREVSWNIISNILFKHGKTFLPLLWESFSNRGNVNNIYSDDYLIRNVFLKYIVSVGGNIDITQIEPMERTDVGNKWEKLCYEIASELYDKSRITIHPILKSKGVPDLVIDYRESGQSHIIIECKLSDYFIDNYIENSSQYEDYVTQCEHLQFWIYKKPEKPIKVFRKKVQILFSDDFLNHPEISDQVKEKIKKFAILNLTGFYEDPKTIFNIESIRTQIEKFIESNCEIECENS